MNMVKSSAALAVVIGTLSLGGCGQGADGSAPVASGNALSADDSSQSQWCHEALQSSDGTSIKFDYQVSESKSDDTNDPTYTGSANNEWLTSPTAPSTVARR